MKNIITLSLLLAGLFISQTTFAQDDSKKKEEHKKKEMEKKSDQDTTVKKKPTGTRMAINSAGLPTKGNKDTKNSNRTVNEPKKEEAKKEETKKEEPKK